MNSFIVLLIQIIIFKSYFVLSLKDLFYVKASWGVWDLFF